jgi:hypothetical protein
LKPSTACGKRETKDSAFDRKAGGGAIITRCTASATFDQLIPSVRAARDFQQMVAELGLNRPVNRIQGAAEHHLVEFLDHLTGAEFA